VVRKAAWMVRDGAVVERYSTLFDDTAEIPFGLGCGGVVDLLLEPAETASAGHCWRRWRRRWAGPRRAWRRGFPRMADRWRGPCSAQTAVEVREPGVECG